MPFKPLVASFHSLDPQFFFFFCPVPFFFPSACLLLLFFKIYCKKKKDLSLHYQILRKRCIHQEDTLQRIFPCETQEEFLPTEGQVGLEFLILLYLSTFSSHVTYFHQWRVLPIQPVILLKGSYCILSRHMEV